MDARAIGQPAMTDGSSPVGRRNCETAENPAAGSGAAPTASSEREIDAVALRALDEAVGQLFSSLELQHTLDAIVRVFVPRYAESAMIVFSDERPRGPGRGGDADRLVLPLSSNARRLGELHLARPAQPVARGLLERIADHAARALENARRFERERHVALTFQNAALVSELPHSPVYRFDALYEAGRAEALVGGDWYDAFRLADDRIVVSIGDVVGSGLGAAIAMVSVRQTLRGVAQVHPDPAVMLEAADRTLRAQFGDRFVTAFVGVMDPVTQQCSYANAGHPPPYVRLPDGTLVQPRTHGVPLGLLDVTQPHQVDHISLPPGAVFLLYTDGLTESTRNLFEGEERLEAALRDPQLPRSERIAQRIHDAVLGDHSRDDVALLAVAVGQAQSVRRWRFDPMWADVAARVRAELCAELANLTPRVVEIETVFAELMGNALRYAPGTVEVLLERRDRDVVLHVLDKGPGFELRPRLPADLYSEFGRGLFLISVLSADFRVERRPGGGSHFRITFHLEDTTA